MPNIIEGHNLTDGLTDRIMRVKEHVGVMQMHLIHGTLVDEMLSQQYLVSLGSSIWTESGMVNACSVLVQCSALAAHGLNVSVMSHLIESLKSRYSY